MRSHVSSAAVNGPVSDVYATSQQQTSTPSGGMTSSYSAPAGSRQLPATPPVNRQQQQQPVRPPVPPPRPPPQHQMSVPAYPTNR